MVRGDGSAESKWMGAVGALFLIGFRSAFSRHSLVIFSSRSRKILCCTQGSGVDGRLLSRATTAFISSKHQVSITPTNNNNVCSLAELPALRPLLGRYPAPSFLFILRVQGSTTATGRENEGGISSPEGAGELAALSVGNGTVTSRRLTIGDGARQNMVECGDGNERGES